MSRGSSITAVCLWAFVFLLHCVGFGSAKVQTIVGGVNSGAQEFPFYVKSTVRFCMRHQVDGPGERNALRTHPSPFHSVFVRERDCAEGRWSLRTWCSRRLTALVRPKGG